VIFGIGLGRTGTTSLNEAMSLLGFSTRKYIPRKELDRICEYDFVADMPIQAIYKYLDLAFPESKFILTIRDIDSWLRSIKTFWEKNPSHLNYPEDIEIYRNLIYRTAIYNEEIIKKSYYKHIREIYAYFQNRNNLLVMDIINGDSWDMLCPFVKKDIPSISFPFLNKGL
jgi:hypothetical protein